jgi:hypothetical protein
VRRTVPPSAEIEEQIDQLLAVGVGENPRESLADLAKLGARPIIQRAVEDEFDAWLGRARYERRPDYQRGPAQRLSPAQGADAGGGARGRDPADQGGRLGRSSRSCFRAARRCCAQSRCTHLSRRWVLRCPAGWLGYQIPKFERE